MEIVKIAINYSHKGKPPKFADEQEKRAFWRVYNGSFRNVGMTPEEWMAAIHDGYGFTTQHNRYRDQENFVAGQHLALDFDTADWRSSFDHLLRDPFIFCFASFLYTTPSHRPDAPKCRVCFVLDRPIHTANKYRLLAQSLVNRYGRPRKADKDGARQYRDADRSCRDVCRLFFGSEGCEIKWLGNVLSLDTAKTELVMPYMEWLRRQEEAAIERAKETVVLRPEDVPAETLQRHLDKLTEKVRSAPAGEQHDTIRDIGRTIGGYVASGYYGELEAVAALQAAIRANPQHQDLYIADEAIEEAVGYGRLAPLTFERIN